MLWCFALSDMEFLGVSVRQFWRSPGVIPIFSCQVWDDSFSSPAWKCIMRVSWGFFLEPHSENSTLLLPLLCGHPPAAHSCAHQPPSHLTVMFSFILWLVWSRKTQTQCSVWQGGSHHSKECAQLWEGTASPSITVRAPQVHPWKQSMAPVSPWPESCAEERHQHGGLLLQPRSLFFSLCLPSLPRRCLFPGSAVLALDIGISIEGCSVVSAQQVSASFWSQVSGAGQIDRSQVTSTGKRWSQPWKRLSSLFCAVFLCLCWFERCTCSEMSLLRAFAVLGIWSAV